MCILCVYIYYGMSGSASRPAAGPKNGAILWLRSLSQFLVLKSEGGWPNLKREMRGEA